MNTIITIGRELGSGGRTIGRSVAIRFGIPYYDREIIDKTAEESGLATEFVKSQEQKISAFYKLCMGMSYGYGNQILSLSSQIYQAQVKVIKGLAEQGPCVIVGRCADYILKDRDDLLRVFIYSDIEHRIRRAVNSYGLNEQTARKEVMKSDKERARHYNLFTDNTWGARENYDLMLDSGYLGLDKCADLICEVASSKK